MTVAMTAMSCSSVKFSTLSHPKNEQYQLNFNNVLIEDQLNFHIGQNSTF